MKKLLITITSFALALNSFAQNNRFSLIEEFTGENCGPCATSNPDFEAKIFATGNESKVLLLKYQSPIPSAGSIYLENTIFTDARMDYYDANSAPSGVLNGMPFGASTAGTPNHVNLLTQSMIDAAYANLTPFTVSVSDPTYLPDGQRFSVSVTVTASSATTLSGTHKIRLALAEYLEFTEAPGSNGEKEFENVVRQMYPDANGVDLDNSWTAGQTRTYTFTGAIPSYFNPSSTTRFFAAWIQNEASKEVLQAGKTGNVTINLPEADAKLNSVAVSGTLNCDNPAIFSGHSVVLENSGASTLTSATIHYRVGTSGTWMTYDWSGSLASGDEATVALPAVTITDGPGSYTIYDSVSNPNGKIDYNDYDNLVGRTVYVLNETPKPLPISHDFETTNSEYIPYATGSFGVPLFVFNGSGVGYGGSSRFLYLALWRYVAGVNGYHILPKPDLSGSGPKAIDFYVAYAQQTSQNDKLEVVYSEDCGNTWTSIWSASGSDLATVAPNNSSTFIPSNNSQWKMRSADLSSVPDGAFIALKVTGDNGNGIFIDNITMRAGPTSIEQLGNNQDFHVYPNPATDVVNIRFDANATFNTTLQITNINGQVVYNTNFDAYKGLNNHDVNVSNLAKGFYFIKLSTDKGQITKKLTIK